MVDFKHPIV